MFLLVGRPPFEIMYNIAQNSDTGGTKLMGQPVFNSIQPHTRFQLTTSTPGRVYYEVKQIGDAAYPLAKSKDRTIPRNQRLLFEQQVALRPSARFRNQNRLVYCLHDKLVALDGTNAGDGAIVFEGGPTVHGCTRYQEYRRVKRRNAQDHRVRAYLARQRASIHVLVHWPPLADHRERDGRIRLRARSSRP